MTAPLPVPPPLGYQMRRTPLDLAKGVGVPGIRQAAGDPHPETVKLIESLIAARATP